MTDTQRECHGPNREWNRESAPTGSQQGAAEKQGGQGLEVWQSLRECAADHSKGDEQSYDQCEWEVAFHDGGRIVDFSLPG